MTACKDFASRRPGSVVIMCYNPRLSTCKADGRLHFFCRVLIDYGTFHDLLMLSVAVMNFLLRRPAVSGVDPLKSESPA
jgi:hypothetical protein